LGEGGKFSALLLEGLDHYRKGRMMEAVRAWEEAYLLEPSNLRAREFLRSALERIHAHMTPNSLAQESQKAQADGAKPHPWLPPESSPPPAMPMPPPVDPNAPTAVYQARPPLPAPGPDTVPPPETAPPPAVSNNPWDDGPSVAIPQKEGASDPGDSSGAWSIHREPLPIEAVADDETYVWMRGARELVALNDFSGALELLGKILERKPSDRDALQMHDLCEQNLTLMFESKIGSMDSRPRVAIPPDEVIWLNLDPRAGFVLAQIDGEVSFEDLYAICGLKRLDTARILCQLLEEGVVKVEGQEKAIAKRAMHRG
jgi:hypothetical protein